MSGERMKSARKRSQKSHGQGRGTKKRERRSEHNRKWTPHIIMPERFPRLKLSECSPKWNWVEAQDGYGSQSC